MSKILDAAQKAFDLFNEGREALEAIASSVKDGKAAISSDDQAALNTMLEKERAESIAAHDNLQNAINASRAGA
jgi:hypothetical protein